MILNDAASGIYVLISDKVRDNTGRVPPAAKILMSLLDAAGVEFRQEEVDWLNAEHTMLAVARPPI
jgi:hypothetical protein